MVGTTARADREDRQVAAQLADARRRLLEELTRADRSVEVVEREFDRVAARFDGARVRSFVPILVERAVRARFGQDGAVADEARV